MTDGKKEYIITCWHCTSQFDAAEASFCSHIDPYLICPYCLKCGCDAAEEYKTTFLKTCPMEILEEKLIRESRTSLKLGEILIRAGKITRSQLLNAIDQQKSFNQKIGQIFVMMNLLTQDELTVYLKEQHGIEHMDLKEFEIDYELVDKIGKPFCLENRIIPFEYYQLNKNKILRLVVYSSEDIPKLKGSDRLKNYTLIPFEAPKADLDRLLADMAASDDVMILE